MAFSSRPSSVVHPDTADLTQERTHVHTGKKIAVVGVGVLGEDKTDRQDPEAVDVDGGQHKMR